MDRIWIGTMMGWAVNHIKADRYSGVSGHKRLPNGVKFLFHFLALLLVATSLASCGGGGGRYADYADDDIASGYDDSSEEIAEEAAEEARLAVYDERGADNDGTSTDTSNVDAEAVSDEGNYSCTQDCSGHEAGFEWAQQNDITDAYDCGGSSQSFIEGCEAFAAARQEQADLETQEEAEQAAQDASEAAAYEYEQDADRDEEE